MNHSKSIISPNASKYLSAILLSVLTFIFYFYALAFALFKLPKFDFLYNFFPILILTLESLTIAFLCRKISKKPLTLTFVSSLSVSVVSILLGFLLFRTIPFSLGLLFLHILFVVCTIVLQMIVKDKSSKRKMKKKMPFEK